MEWNGKKRSKAKIKEKRRKKRGRRIGEEDWEEEGEDEDMVEPPRQQSESAASISSSIMLKIPPENMSLLREDFLASKCGLSVEEFLTAAIGAMKLRKQEIKSMTADLVDFFDLVDINGDGFMEWEEFVMFLLDAVVEREGGRKEEEFQFLDTRVVQSAAIRDTIECVKMIPALGKVIMGVGSMIHMFGADEKSLPSNTVPVYKFPILSSSNKPDLPGAKHLTILHMEYLEGQDVLAVLRSDMYIEFFKFLSRSNYSMETIESLGKIAMNKPCHKMTFRISQHRKPRLLVIGTSPVIDSFLFVPMGSNGLASLSDHKTMEMHSDYVRDIITVNSGPSRFIVSASLDKTVMFWDLETMEYKFKRTGHSAGVESLAFGGKSLLFAGGYDYSIIIWDITAAINKPLFHLKGGHQSSVTKVIGLESLDRCATLDETGVLAWWDISRNVNSVESRLIDTVTCPEDHARSFDIIAELPRYFEALHGVIFLAAGKRQHIFKLKDISSHEGIPVNTLYSPNLLSLFTIHSHEIIFWSVITGEHYKTNKELVGVHSKITCATLDDRCRRIIVGDTTGGIRFYNCLNGHFIKVLDSLGAPIKQLIYSSDKNLIVLTENSDVFIVDDTVDVTVPNVEFVLRSLHFPSGSICSDLVCIAYSEALGLIASVDSMGMLVIWNYQFLTPEFMMANVSGNASEVSHIQFIKEYPMLLVADNSKRFSIITLRTKSGSNEKQHIWRLESLAAYRDPEEEEDAGPNTVGARATPYGNDRARKFLEVDGEIRSLSIHVTTDLEDHDEDASEKLMKELEGSDITDAHSIMSSKKVDQSRFPSGTRVRVVCGFESGTMSITDITSALQVIDIGPYNHHDHASAQLIFNPKSRCVKHIGDSDCHKLLTSEEVNAMTKFATCSVECIKDTHRGAITSLQLIGPWQWILSASEDKSIIAWDVDGTYKGLLTRGSEMDKLFHKSWSNPEDLVERNRKRMLHAEDAVERLDLLRVAKEQLNHRRSKPQLPTELSTDSKLVNSRPNAATHNSVLTDPRDLNRALDEEALGGTGKIPVNAESIAKSLRVVEKYPNRTRLLCQLENRITYDPSKKDVARLQLSSSHSLTRLSDTAKRTKRRRRRKVISSDETWGAECLLDKKYLKTIQIADECLAQNTEERQKSSSETSTAKLSKWQYASEIAQIDAQDPGNWEISSLNRLREMYQHMHREMEKNGRITNDQEQIIMLKLKALCPGGDVSGYFRELKASYRERMRRKQQQKLKTRSLLSTNESTSSIPVHATAEGNVYTEENGELVHQSRVGGESGVDKSQPKEGIVITDEFQTESAKSKASPLKTPTELTSPIRKDKWEHSQVTTFTRGKSEPHLTGNIASDKHFRRMNTCGQVPLSTSFPAPKQNKPPTSLLDPPDFLTTRQQTRNLVQEFDAKMKRTEKLARKAVKNTRKRVRQSKREIKSCTATLIQSGAVRFHANPLELSPKVSHDFMKESIASKWSDKAKTLMLESKHVKKQHPRLKLHAKPSFEDISRLLQRTSSTIAETYQQQVQREEQLLARKSFGPYISTELIQLFELFKSMPKQTPGPEDTVLLAGSNEKEELGDGHSTNPVYGCIDLAELVKHRWMRNRPHFKSFLDKIVLMKRPNMSAGLFISLSRIIAQVCPLMTLKDRRELMEYFRVFRVVEGANKPVVEVAFTRDQRAQLKKIFDYFDTDNSGTINREEIRAALDKTYQSRMTTDDALLGDDQEFEKRIDDESLGSIISEGVTHSSVSSVVEEEESVESSEIDFASFLQLFGNFIV